VQQLATRSPHRRRLHVAAALGCLLLTACVPAATPTLFRPPTAQPKGVPVQTSTPPPLATSTTTPSPDPTLSSSPTACLNSLDFVEDVTIPDGTVVQPGANVDKQWLVVNDGTCSWTDDYRLKFVGGDPLGVAEDQPLSPAAAGSQVVLRIVFTASQQSGRYFSKWQAVDPDGSAFGSEVYLDIIVGG
jgi:hypothetical protein